MEMSLHIIVGIGKGCNNPAGSVSSLLFRWQMSHTRKYSFIWAQAPCQ